MNLSTKSTTLLSPYSFLNSRLIKNDCIECYQKTLALQGMGTTAAIQYSKGMYSDSHHILTFPKLLINKFSMVSNVIKQGKFSDSHYIFCFPAVEENILINGKEINHNGLYVITPEEILHSRNISEYSLFIIVVHQKELEKYLDHSSINQLRYSPENIRLGKTYLPYLIETKNKLRSNLTWLYENYPLMNRQALLDTEEHILQCLEKLVRVSPQRKNIIITPNSRKNIVDRCTNYINQTNDIEFNIAQLAAHAFCSIRSLEYAFKSILGVTPKQFLILRRMHLIRETIKANNHYLINAILDNYGVINRSRFKKEFFQMFGEQLSELAKK